MLFDTDILIWIQRGNEKAAELIERDFNRFISVFTYMELLQRAAHKTQSRLIKDFLSEYGFQLLPLSENIGHRASIYVEEFALSSGLWPADALIAATAAENNITLVSGNSKHFRPIKDLMLKIFRP